MKLTQEDKERRRLARWWRSLPADRRKAIKASLTPEKLEEFRAEGLIDAMGYLTGLGQLRLHQLRLREWIANKRLEEQQKAQGITSSVFDTEVS